MNCIKRWLNGQGWYFVESIIIIIIIINYFENNHFFHAVLGLDTCPNMKSLHISLIIAHSGKTKQFHVIIHTFSPSLPAPTLHFHFIPATSIFLQSDTQSSTLLCSRCPNHLNLPCITTSATLCLPKRLYKSTPLSILQRHSVHPSHHHPLRPLQTKQIFSLHHAGFSPIFPHTLDT